MMKVSYENVINIEGVGVFRKTGARKWGFTQYDRIDGDGFFVAQTGDGELHYFFKQMGELNKEVTVAFCSPNLYPLFVELFKKDDINKTTTDSN